MTFRIDDFKSRVGAGGGFAMGNLFKVSLPALEGFSSEEISFLCKSSALPGRQVTSVDYPMGTTVTKIANGFINTEVTLTFHCLNDYKVRRYFEAWQKTAHNNDTYTIGYHKEYVRDVTIHQLRKGVGFPIGKKKIFDAGKLPSNIASRLPRLGPLDLAQGELDLDFITGDQIAYSCKLIDAYPTGLQEIALSDDGQLLEVSVTLSYKDWQSDGKGATGGNFAAGIIGSIIQKVTQ